MNKVVRISNNNRPKHRQNAAPSAQLRRMTGTAEAVIRALRPSDPLYILRPDVLEATAKHFLSAFPGTTLFAVKTNPHEEVIRTLYKSGVRSFDVASMAEARLVHATCPAARMYFMHPVKSPEAIRDAYFNLGVRDFVLDTQDELYKIIRETGLAGDINLYVRLSLPKNNEAAIDFSGKFGAAPGEAAELLRQCRPIAQELGLCFHVGTQITDPSVYARGVAAAADVIRDSGVKVDVLDVGGGFPVSYPGEDVPALQECIAHMTDALDKNGLSGMPLLAEPGRALVAESGALVARVELRKGNVLYLNDGTYGGLFDAGPLLNVVFPVKAVRAAGEMSDEMQEFAFVGPTCDSLDSMKGPFLLPADIKMGDWIEIGNLGAYSQSMRTNFNGFGHADTVCLLP